MQLRSEKGFTLIELLAVIAVLSILTLMVVPAVLKILDEAKEKIFLSQARSIYKAAENQYSTDRVEGRRVDVYNSSGEDQLVMSGLSNVIYNIEFVESRIVEFQVTAMGYSISLSSTYVKITDITKENLNQGEIVTEYADASGANSPELAQGMVPIRYDGSKWVKADVTEEWYNYADKEWANAVLVKLNGTNSRNYYLSDDAIGHEVLESDILAYYVWIPRYIYKITSGWHDSPNGEILIQFSQGINDNWNSATIGSINTTTSASASNNAWTNHPGFTFGTDELKGIWVSKFQATAMEGVVNLEIDFENGCDSGDNADKTVNIIPGVPSWRCLEPGVAFTVTKVMEENSLYGWSETGIDTHMMKNVEWGALAYLSKSSYGKGTSLGRNSSTTYLTGGGSGTAYKSNVSQSSTNNVYGVYDMSGEGEYGTYVSGIVEDSDFAEAFALAIIEAEDKYKDSYQVGECDGEAAAYEITANHKGDAFWETSSAGTNGGHAWLGDFTYMITECWPILLRSEYFTFLPAFSNIWAGTSFRPVLLVGAGL